MKPTCAPLAAVLYLLLSVSLHAANWPQWRGPNYNGTTDEKNPPTEFSKTNNVKWVVTLPGPGAATPIIWNDHVFVSSTDSQSRTLRAVCLDRKNGKELWQQEVGPGFARDNQSNFASPSPVTDGKLVVFFYGNGDLAAFDFQGKKLWARNLQKDYGDFSFNWTFSSSPTLHDGTLYLQVLQRDRPARGRGSEGSESFLLALDPQTGKELWRHIRKTEARMESMEAYSTPIPIRNDGRTEMLVAGADYLTAHDPKTGDEIWRWGTWNPSARAGNFRLVPSPVASGDVILICAPQRSPLYALKPNGKGTLDDSALLWKSEQRELSSDVATPLAYDGRFYVVNGERQMIMRLEPATGKADWIGELTRGVKIECSPTCADGKIYFQNFRGDIFIVAAGPEFKLLNTIPMGDDGDNQLRAAIPISQGNLFIRTGNKLYCIGK